MFQQHRSASGLTGQPEASQIDTLPCCLGEEAKDVLTSTGISEDEKEVYNQVVACLLQGQD